MTPTHTTRSFRRLVLATVALVVVWLLWQSARAGEISLKWDAVDHPDLATYRVETVQGEWSEMLTTTETAATVLMGWEDSTKCMDVEVTVLSCDAAGACSGPSTPLVGWPSPVITSVELEDGTTVVVGQNLGPSALVYVNADADAFLLGDAAVPIDREYDPNDCRSLDLGNVGQPTRVVVHRPHDDTVAFWALVLLPPAGLKRTDTRP